MLSEADIKMRGPDTICKQKGIVLMHIPLEATAKEKRMERRGSHDIVVADQQRATVSPAISLTLHDGPPTEYV